MILIFYLSNPKNNTIRRKSAIFPIYELGRLFLAILQYGQDGTEPQFEGALAMAWAFIKPKLDRDEERYQESVARGSYAAYCREAKKRGLSKLPKEIWSKMSIDERKQLLSSDDTGYPTADTTTETDTSISASASTITPAVADILAHGRISLSPFEIVTLQSKMGADDLEIYLVRLSHYISNNAYRLESASQKSAQCHKSVILSGAAAESKNLRTYGT